jgi:hypothetical protein
MAARQTLIHTQLQAHFGATPPEQLTIAHRHFPARVRVDVQHAIDTFLAGVTVRQFCAVNSQYGAGVGALIQLLVRNPHMPAVAGPPQFAEIDIGEPEPVRCLDNGLWLLEEAGVPVAVLMQQVQGHLPAVQFEVAAPAGEAGEAFSRRFFKHLEAAVSQARSYRGKVLSLEWEMSYRGVGTGIKVHRLRRVERDQVILPRQTLELLERNVIQFVRQRPRLAAKGLATKKGLLFYGPPGTGKTHTIHYLAGALEGVTTLLVTAEQVGGLGEYMTLARLLQPSMVVIEDADLIARQRAHMHGPMEEALLNKLLNEMDGLREEADVLFVLTTNRPEALEATLSSRPGRIDQAIEFPFPDDDGRQKLVRLYAREMSLPAEVVAAVVRKTAGVSAAFIKELMRRATQFCLERDGECLAVADVDGALEEMLFRGGSLNRKLLGGQIDPVGFRNRPEDE